MSVDEFGASGNDARDGHDSDPVALPTDIPGVALWWSSLAQPVELRAQRVAWLSPAEHARAARFGTEDLRQKYIAGRSTLRLILGRTLGIAPGTVPIRRGTRGRPELAGAARILDFNISHTRGGAVIGIAQGLPSETRIGVDIEREDRQLGADRLAGKFLSSEEQMSLPNLDVDGRRLRFLRYWTCKEAMSKATGDGLAAPFARLTLRIDGMPELVAGPAPYVPGTWQLRAIAVPAGFLATVALWRGDESPANPGALAPALR